MAVCSFDGNTDMYGLGIRIGFYLQWYAVEIASWFAPSEVNGARLTNSVFIAATFLALLIQIVRDVSSLQVVEVYIILLLTFGYYLFLVPVYAWRFLTGYDPKFDPTRYSQVWTGEVYSVLNFLLLTAVASFQLWFWFSRVPQLDKQSCQQYGFFFAKIRLNEKSFEVLNILLYFLLLSCCAVVLSITILIKAKLVEEKQPKRWTRSETSLGRRSIPNAREAAHIKSLQKLRSACNVAVASTVITATELTIKWNKIQGVNSLTSAGQTIPLLIGIATIIRIAYVRRSEGEPTWDPYGRWAESTRVIRTPTSPGPLPTDRGPFPREMPRNRMPVMLDE